MFKHLFIIISICLSSLLSHGQRSLGFSAGFLKSYSTLQEENYPNNIDTDGNNSRYSSELEDNPGFYLALNWNRPLNENLKFNYRLNLKKRNLDYSFINEWEIEYSTPGLPGLFKARDMIDYRYNNFYIGNEIGLSIYFKKEGRLYSRINFGCDILFISLSEYRGNIFYESSGSYRLGSHLHQQKVSNKLINNQNLNFYSSVGFGFQLINSKTLSLFIESNYIIPFNKTIANPSEPKSGYSHNIKTYDLTIGLGISYKLGNN